MEKTNRIPEAFLIAIAIVVMGFCLKAGIDNFTNKDRRVTANLTIKLIPLQVKSGRF